MTTDLLAAQFEHGLTALLDGLAPSATADDGGEVTCAPE
jgi:hypothetical protein